jgi:hypothetical protein
MRWLLLVLGLVWLALVPVPAFSQASHEGPSSAQYDQYGLPEVGGRAAHDAIVASDAIRASSDEVQGAKASAEAELPSAPSELNAALAEEGNAEEQNESANTVALTELPQTGGPSPLWFGVPLVCVGSLLVRRIFLS